MSKAKISKNIVKACEFYLKRDYENAEKIMAKITEPAYQTAAIYAQTALFSWDFDRATSLCMEFLPYINEWQGHTYNMYEAGVAMIAFCGYKTDKEKVLSYLINLKNSFEDKEDNVCTERITKLMIDIINKYVNLLSSSKFEKKYTPPENPISLDEAISYLQKYKKDLTADTQDDAEYILSRMKRKMDCIEFVRLYECFSDSPKLTERTRFDAIEMYLYLDMPDKAGKAVCDFCKSSSWTPAEKIMIMPVSIFTYDTNLWDIFTNDMFEYIRKTPNYYFRDKV